MQFVEGSAEVLTNWMPSFGGWGVVRVDGGAADGGGCSGEQTGEGFDEADLRGTSRVLHALKPVYVWAASRRFCRRSRRWECSSGLSGS